mmetsp:Transcript_20783/g.30848  ORF Transcript_20783/g.30848 Transcript_20783/m.30848 type:complete len:83 (-) Transcript_20783:280-528(-)
MEIGDRTYESADDLVYEMQPSSADSTATADEHIIPGFVFVLLLSCWNNFFHGSSDATRKDAAVHLLGIDGPSYNPDRGGVIV